MTEAEDKIRYEKNFESIFSKLNKMLPTSTFIAVMTCLVIVGGSLFGLMYNDLQNFKTVSTAQFTEQRVEVIKEIGELKILIETKIQ